MYIYNNIRNWWAARNVKNPPANNYGLLYDIRGCIRSTNCRTSKHSKNHAVFERQNHFVPDIEKTHLSFALIPVMLSCSAGQVIIEFR